MDDLLLKSKIKIFFSGNLSGFRIFPDFPGFFPDFLFFQISTIIFQRINAAYMKHNIFPFRIFSPDFPDHSGFNLILYFFRLSFI